MAKQYYTDPIDKYVDWGGDEHTSGIPVAGSSVQNFIKDSLESKAGYIHHDLGSNMYYAFADQDTYNEWQESVDDPEIPEKTYLILFSFMAPERYTASITLTGSTQQQTIVKNGTTNNIITFKYNVLDNVTGQDVGSTANVTYKIQNGGNSSTVYGTIDADTDITFLLDSYISAGMNRIQLSINDTQTHAQASISLTYYVIDMYCSSQFDNLQPITEDIMQVSVTATGDSAKHFEFYIDGEQVIPLEGDIAITAYTGTTIADIDISGYANGKHSLQIRIYIIQNYSRLYSDVLYYDFIKNTSENVEFLMKFNIDQSFGIVTNSHPYVFPGKQYDEVRFDWSLYYHTYKTVNVTLDYEEGVNSLKVVPGKSEEFTHYFGTAGSKTITFSGDGSVYTLPVLISETDLGF